MTTAISETTIQPIGRYVQARSGLAGGLNAYAHADGDPLSGTDPFGLRRLPQRTGNPFQQNRQNQTSYGSRYNYTNPSSPYYLPPTGSAQRLPQALRDYLTQQVIREQVQRRNEQANQWLDWLERQLKDIKDMQEQRRIREQISRAREELPTPLPTSCPRVTVGAP